MSASTPESLPFSSPALGVPPSVGGMDLAGVRLPAGGLAPGRDVPYWIREAPVTDPVTLASALAGRFEDTGLWPLLWLDDDEDPWVRIDDVELDLGVIDEIDVEKELLEDRWLQFPPGNEKAISPFGQRFPGMAGGSTREERQVDRPFERLVAVADEARLILCPCQRPADSVAVLGQMPLGLTGVAISAMLRSWEQRFGAVVVAMHPWGLTLTVSRPPENDEQAMLLAAEIWTFCAPPETGLPGSIQRLAGALGAQDPAHVEWFESDAIGPTLWTIGWYDD